jgi:hypothetical protein
VFKYLLQNADFGGIFRFVSPNFLKVVSPFTLMEVGKRLTANKADTEKWSRALRSRRELLDSCSVGITLSEEESDSERAPCGESLGKDRGDRVLRLFFLQILREPTWFLDFRSIAFVERSGGSLQWSPQPYYYEFSPKFLSGIRMLYRGFYSGDESLFDQALIELRLMPAKKSLVRHFGTGDQTSVTFQLKTFQNTFTEVFEECAREKVKLETDFFVLGIALLSLYENLESLGKPLNARASFEEALALIEGRL